MKKDLSDLFFFNILNDGILIINKTKLSIINYNKRFSEMFEIKEKVNTKYLNYCGIDIYAIRNKNLNNFEIYSDLLDKYFEINFIEKENYYYLIITEITNKMINLNIQKNIEIINKAIFNASNIEEMLRNVLKSILDIFDVERSWLLYPCDPLAEKYTVPIMETKEGFHEPDRLELPIDSYSKKVFEAVHNTDEPVAFYSNKEPKLPPVIVKEHFVKTQLIIALKPKIKKKWVFGIHRCKWNKSWSISDKKLFKTISERITDGLNSFLFWEEMKQSKENFEIIFNNLNDAVMIQDYKTGEIIDVNDTTVTMYGYKSKEELIGSNLDKGSAETKTYNKAKGLALINKVIKNNEPINFEWKSKKADGSLFWTEIGLSKVKISGITRILAVIRDITDKKKAELNLKESEERFRNLAETTSTSIMLFQNNNCIYANPSAEKLLGYNFNKLKNINYLKLIASEDRDKIENLNNHYFKKNKKPVSNGFEIRIITRNGIRKWVYIQFGSTIINNEKSVLITAIDITTNKRNEEELAKVNRLESIATLAGGIAHDFNNILTGIYGNLSLAKINMDSNKKEFEFIRDAIYSMDRAKYLTKQLLTFAKGGAPIKENLELNRIIKSITKFDLSGSNINAHFNIHKNLWSINADKGQLSQVFSNIIINARQAMKEGGNLYINLTNYTLQNESLNINKGKYVKIEIIDEGEGINPETIDKIFDPYFTTKKEGNGLGMAIVYSIIKKHNGNITVESKKGEGTTFTIYLPVENKLNFLPKNKTSNPIKTPKFNKKVLIMDDEETIRILAKNIFEELGFDVITAIDGNEAIKTYLENLNNYDKFDLVIMDLTIPAGMGGKEAAQNILKIDPKANLIVSSGYSNDPIIANYNEYGFISVIEKPYTYQQVLDCINRIYK